MKTLKRFIIFFPFFIPLIYLMLTAVYSMLLDYKGGCFYGTHDIKVDEGLVYFADEKNINYCDMLRQSFNDDKVFSEFISLEFFDGLGINHASVVQDLYKYYGSDKFWQKAKSLNQDKKQRVKIYLEYE